MNSCEKISNKSLGLYHASMRGGGLIWSLALAKTCDYTFLSVASCLVPMLAVRKNVNKV